MSSEDDSVEEGDEGGVIVSSCVKSPWVIILANLDVVAVFGWKLP